MITLNERLNEEDGEEHLANCECCQNFMRMEKKYDDLKNNIFDIANEEIEFEENELKDIRETKGDINSYGAGYSTGIIEAMKKIITALQE